jgi:hypothetical protein
MPVACRSRFDGDEYIQPSRRPAISFARLACLQHETERHLFFNAFCDGFKSMTANEGGISVTYLPCIDHER